MPPPLRLALLLGAVACAAVAGCADAPPAPAPATPAAYLSEVEALLDPPGRLAASIAEAADGTQTRPDTERIEDLVDGARDRLERFRALRLDDPGLRAQRDRLSAAYGRMLPLMETAAGALGRTDRAALVRAATPFLDALRALPSAASPPSR